MTEPIQKAGCYNRNTAGSPVKNCPVCDGSGFMPHHHLQNSNPFGYQGITQGRKMKSYLPEQTERCSCAYSPTGNLIGQCLRCTKMVMDARNDGAQKEREHLIQAIEELIDHETTSEMEYQKDAGKNYDPNSYGRGFHAGFVASLNLVKESLEEDEVERNKKDI